MKVPTERGPASDAVLTTLTSHEAGSGGSHAAGAVADALDLCAREGDLLDDDDLQLALFCLYELHYGGLEGVDPAWEWDPDLLRVRSLIEAQLEDVLRERVPGPDVLPEGQGAVAEALATLTGQEGGPGLAAFVARRATMGQVHEFFLQRSIYHLKEADPHTWAIPRLTGPAKAALVEIQSDEYGGGDPTRVHATLFARAMRSAGLDSTYGAYIDQACAPVLAGVNAMSMFGLHRRLRGAIVGHLAAFEMTSTTPNRLYGNGLRRLGFGPDATAYFDEHVEADAVHEQIAAHDLAGALAADEPELTQDIMFGAGACLLLDDLAGEHLMDSWANGRTSLYAPLSRTLIGSDA